MQYPEPDAGCRRHLRRAGTVPSCDAGPDPAKRTPDRGVGSVRCSARGSIPPPFQFETSLVNSFGFVFRFSRVTCAQTPPWQECAPVPGGQRELCGSRKSPSKPNGPVDPTPISGSLAAPKLMSFRHTPMAGQDQDASQKPQCPTCGAAEARALLCAPPAIVYVNCRACGAAWGIRERRRWRRQPEDPLDQFRLEQKIE